jgi:gliding motility-associated-like protein
LTTPSLQSLAVGSYSFTATDQNGCTTSASGQVNQPTSLAINLGEDTSVCSIEPFVINAPSGFANYLWNDGQQSSAITAITSGNYAVTVTNSSGCTASDNININLGSSTTIDLGNDITIYEGNSIGIFPTISGNGGGNYLWLPSETLNCGDCKNPVASPLENTTYTLNYTDNNGCLSVDSIQIVVIPIGDLFFPTAFSPNGDGYNDQYKIYGSSVKNLVLKIYNRWGELVFETSNINEGWDGTYKSTPQPIGVYVYTGVATFMNNITLDYKGSITLIR